MPTAQHPFGLKKLLLLGLLCLAGYGGSCGDTPPPPGGGDQTPPEISSTSPAANATDIVIGSAIQVVFSEDIDPATVTPASVSVRVAAGAAVAVTLSLSNDTLDITPDTDLVYSTEYTVTLTTAIRDMAGNQLSSDYLFAFTTQPDPNTLPPTVTGTDPPDGAFNVPVGATINATFSKGMDSASVVSAFTVSALPGTVEYNRTNRTATFTPDLLMEFEVLYLATISIAATDTFGISMAQAYTWDFVTESDPLAPLLVIDYPFDGVIIGDSVTLMAAAIHPVGTDSVVFYNGTIRMGEATPAGANLFSWFWDASSLITAADYPVYARGYYDDGVQVHDGISDTIGVISRWMELGTDPDDPWRVDLARVLARTSDSLLWLRLEFQEDWNEWPYPKLDSVVNEIPYFSFDSALALGLYFDIDQNPATGRNDFDGRIQLNDVGAELQVLIGIFGGYQTLREWNAAADSFEIVFDTTGLAWHFVPPSDNQLEIAIRWADLQTNSLRFLALNALVISSGGGGDPTPLHDMLPNEGEGSFLLQNINRYVGGKPSGIPVLFRPAGHGLPPNDRIRITPIFD